MTRTYISNLKQHVDLSWVPKYHFDFISLNFEKNVLFINAKHCFTIQYKNLNSQVEQVNNKWRIWPSEICLK